VNASESRRTHFKYECCETPVDNMLASLDGLPEDDFDTRLETLANAVALLAKDVEELKKGKR